MILNNLSATQIVDRIQVLPESLQIALDDLDIKTFIDEVARTAGVAENNIRIFEGMVSMVIIGFLRPGGLAAEFQELGLDPITAIAAAEKIAKEVFEPVRTDIANVALLPRDVPEPEEKTPGPTLDLKASPPKPVALPIKNTPTNTTPTAVPSITSTPARAPQSPAIPGPSAASVSAAVAAPRPFMLQKETSSEPVVANSGFKLNIDPKVFNRAAANPSMPVPRPQARPAELELGRVADKANKADTKMSTAPTPRVVHYADVKGSLGVTPAPAIRPQPQQPPAQKQNTPSVAAPAAVPPTTFANKPAPLPNAPIDPIPPVKPIPATAPAPVRPSPFSLGTVVTPPAPSIIKNAPGVPPTVPAPATPQASSAPDLKKPARVVNFTTEDDSTKTP